jgi:hypothetical protein
VSDNLHLFFADFAAACGAFFGAAFAAGFAGLTFCVNADAATDLASLLAFLFFKELS